MRGGGAELSLCWPIEFFKKALEMEGLFRLSGTANELAKAKQLYDKGDTDAENLKKWNAHVVADLLKTFLR